MYIDLSGTWKLWMGKEEQLTAPGLEECQMQSAEYLGKQPKQYTAKLPKGEPAGTVTLPGIMQAQGFGMPVTQNTPWVSGLHDPFWYEREEYQYGQEEGIKIPFLPQPRCHYIGMAWYEREYILEASCPETLYLVMELTHWRTHLWVDGNYKGNDCSLCTAHEICCGILAPGKHIFTIGIDNRMQYPYRPDGHGVSDALGASWNGILGELALLSESERLVREKVRQKYALDHPRRMEVAEGRFYVDNRPEYFRGTHFGGDYMATGYPVVERAWWDKIMQIVKQWGLNFIRCHSYCPPEAAFAAADEAGVYLQPECGMWNIFREGSLMQEVLREETQRILKQFGHHPSFVLFSPTNEPGGEWYGPLRRWVEETKSFDAQLGYENRRLYTAQSGWFYDVPPKKVTGTDYLYFHRSNYGPILGGNIRNFEGWKGKDYSPSLEGAMLPVICHEMGQWCSYPDFSFLDKKFGYLEPKMFDIFRQNAKAQGLEQYSKEFAFCSGRTQVMMYKEDIEANLRTPQLYGFEMLDLHDYMGQGAALVGVLDALWENKGYVQPEEFRQFCSETVLLARIPSYTYRNTDSVDILIEICHFGKHSLQDQELDWSLSDGTSFVQQGKFDCAEVAIGKNQNVGTIHLDFKTLNIERNCHMTFRLSMGEVQNQWNIYVYCERKSSSTAIYTRSWTQARDYLEQGLSVVYSPWLSELDFECPSLSERPVFWNAQMGPGWERGMGLVIREEHPVFDDFPVQRFADWQWEDILHNARGFCIDHMPEGPKPIVRVIDDWNRNLPLALMWEAKAGNGKLFFVSACLEGSFDERPVAYSLKQAIIDYVSSDRFQPLEEVAFEQIESHLFNVLRTGTLIADVAMGAGAKIGNPAAIFDPNPNNSFVLEGTQFPVHMDLILDHPILLEGLLYIPDQKDRLHEGCIRKYRIEAWQKGCLMTAAEGTLHNSLFSQKMLFAEAVVTDCVRIAVFSCYGCQEKVIWEERREGWFPVSEKPKAVVKAAGFHLICNVAGPQKDIRFWDKNRSSSTREIDN